MRMIQGLFATLIAVFILAIVIVFPIAKVVDNQFLSESFYTERLDDIGVYDTARNILLESIKMKMDEAVDANDIQAETAVWMLSSVEEVLTREYTAALMKKMLSGTMLYLSGQADALPTFNLEPKYAELRVVIMEGLTLERVLSTVNLSSDKISEDTLELMGIIDANGEINGILKEQAMRMTFDRNEVLKAPFMMDTITDVMMFNGNENALMELEKVKKQVTFFHKAVMPLLLLLSFLTVIVLLMNFGRLRIGFRLNGWAYTVGAMGTMIIGTMISHSTGWVYRWFNTKVVGSGINSATLFTYDQLVQPLGNAIVSASLIFFGIGVVFLVLSILFASKRTKRRTRQDAMQDI